MIQMKDSLGNMYSQQVPYLSYIHTLFGRKIAVETANTALNYPVQGLWWRYFQNCYVSV